MSSNNITTVQVPGAMADGSSRARAIGPLQSRGFGEVTVPIPPTSYADDLAALERTLERVDGAVVGRRKNNGSISRRGFEAIAGRFAATTWSIRKPTPSRMEPSHA